ncbi:hypothetical protein [Haloarcula argentinensis]|uniref:hypothetical protein n=1 Tax=Haloarcula argentinensis TaxID=43776 RepID=UPI0002B13A0E|nr:hypothetical protein [Haloarcula argentinensis]EMA25733.1 hypothetical protein C443_02949 [Haloarcula argentinensis DSM 12282]
MSYQNRVSDYMNIRSLPAMLSVAFVAASLYQFGGIPTVESCGCSVNYSLARRS